MYREWLLPVTLGAASWFGPLPLLRLPLLFVHRPDVMSWYRKKSIGNAPPAPYFAPLLNHAVNALYLHAAGNDSVRDTRLQMAALGLLYATSYAYWATGQAKAAAFRWCGIVVALVGAAYAIGSHGFTSPHQSINFLGVCGAAAALFMTAAPLLNLVSCSCRRMLPSLTLLGFCTLRCWCPLGLHFGAPGCI